MNHQSKIVELMNLYTEMLEENKKAKQAYEKASDGLPQNEWYLNTLVEKPYSDTMLHSIIVIINRLNNR